jgi:hypothetical protein
MHDNNANTANNIKNYVNDKSEKNDINDRNDNNCIDDNRSSSEENDVMTKMTTVTH